MRNGCGDTREEMEKNCLRHLDVVEYMEKVVQTPI